MLASAYGAETVLKQDDMCLKCVADKFIDSKKELDRKEKWREVLCKKLFMGNHNIRPSELLPETRFILTVALVTGWASPG